MHSDSGISSPPTSFPQQQNQNVVEVQPNERQAAVIYARLPVPAMSSSNIEAWFTSMDFWFTASGIRSDKQKAATVFAALDPTVVSQLAQVIADMPQSDKFEYVKTKIIEHFADREQRRLNRLLSELPLGDRKPSELYLEMKRVAGTTLGDAALNGLWTKRLPAFAQPVIAASSGTAAEFMKIADSIIDAVAPQQVAQVRTDAAELNQLRTAIEDLSKRVERLSSKSRSRSQTRSTPTKYNNSKSTSRPQQARNRSPSSANAECWYHQKYGTNARKYHSPCRRRQRSVQTITTDGKNLLGKRVTKCSESSVTERQVFRLQVRDKTTSTIFLIDTEADVSILPLTTLSYDIRPTATKLYAANRAAIKVLGEKRIRLDLGLRRDFVWSFLVADVTQPIIGADFIKFYDLLIDMR
ncbi:uncharacterized protein [Eurosta solidaginis]|uniref:uncharacterized protein n=1 Tax=Eurosta solidaginis TaxID=178769 RepID=UPI0035310FE4